ncbi:phytanoyl-CoA dioxygenase family protein, partial [Myxococcota bacterium]|nr:phytanoyl-CoA dioxygenase family protein [Myxococcota bacterium]
MASSDEHQSDRIETVPRSTEISEIMTIIRRDGGVIIEDVLDSELVAQIDSEIVPHLDKLSWNQAGENESKSFFGHCTKRKTNLVTLSPTFREHVLDSDYLLALIDAMLLPYADSYWMNTAVAVEIHPSENAQLLHRDLGNYPHFETLGPAGPEVSVNCIIALTEFSEEVGATRAIPGSHLWPDFRKRGNPEQTIPVEMQPGSGFLYSAKLIHGGGANRSVDRRRRGLAMNYNLGWLVPE